MSILRLPNYDVLDHEERNGVLRIEIVKTPGPSTCPHCGVWGGRRHGFGTKRQTFHDLPHGPTKVVLIIDRQRYRCLECQRTFMDRLPDMSDEHGMTKRLESYVLEEAYRATFSSVAAVVGVTEGTIRKMFKKAMESADARRDLITPRVLGIDEVGLYRKSKRPCAVFTNIQQKTVVEIIRDRDKKSVIRFLHSLEASEVEAVTADLWDGYHHAAREVFPYALVVADKFHVVKLVNDAMDKCRKSQNAGSESKRRYLRGLRLPLLSRAKDISTAKDASGREWIRSKQRQLDVIFDQFPALYDAYLCKEFFYDIYDAPTLEAAKEAFAFFESSITGPIAEHFQPVAKTIRYFEEAIFNYWHQPFTNAWTETANGLIRRVFDRGRGYSFDVLRSKVIHTYGSQRLPAQRVKRTDFAYSPSLHPRTYGTDLSTLEIIPPISLESPVST